jgi:hypothetical protein
MDVQSMTEGDLVLASQELGRDGDRIREQRRTIADELRRRHAAHASARAAVNHVLDGGALVEHHADGSVTIHAALAVTAAAPGDH